MSAPNPRKIACRIISDVLQKGRSLDAALSTHNLPGTRQALARELATGTLRYYHGLAQCLAKLVTKPLKERDQDIQLVLLTGLYQILFTRQANHAIVNEAVKLAASRDKGWARGLVNAVLRRAIREASDLKSLIDGDPAVAYPPWLANQIIKDWPASSEMILKAGNNKASMWIRVNLARNSTGDYRTQLNQAGISAQPGLVEGALCLDQPVPVDQLPGFSAGSCSVQDLSAQLAAVAMAPASGESILDACSAPGGKLIHLMELAPDCEFTAVDLNDRLPRIQENLDRCGMSARVLGGDLRHTINASQEQFDAILFDAPCTGTGVIRRHPDIRLLKRPTDIIKTTRLQYELLEHLWLAVKPGGRLLYTTCSILRDENDHLVSRFMECRGDVAEHKLSEAWGSQLPTGRQRFPGQDGGDGFYYCLLVKSGDR